MLTTLLILGTIVFFTIIGHLFSFVFDLLVLLPRSEPEENLELLLLRQQLRILQRTHPRPPRLSVLEKLPLAVLAAKLARSSSESRARLTQSLVLFTPETVLPWHRDLVRRKRTFPQRRSRGRPRITAELEALIIRLARENPRWGYGKLQGELMKLGYRLGESTVRDVLKRQHILPTPQRSRSSSTWRAFLRHYKQQFLACDFFTVEALSLKTLYVLFFIEIGTRRIHLAGCTLKPTATWATQQERQLVWKLQDQGRVMRFLKYTTAMPSFPPALMLCLHLANLEVILTPYLTPNANAFRLRGGSAVCARNVWITCSSWNERHLGYVLRQYSQYYNQARPHQGIGQEVPESANDHQKEGPVQRPDVLGGLIHDYYRAAA